jgi:hypothetical protein
MLRSSLPYWRSLRLESPKPSVRGLQIMLPRLLEILDSDVTLLRAHAEPPLLAGAADPGCSVNLLEQASMIRHT